MALLLVLAFIAGVVAFVMMARRDAKKHHATDSGGFAGDEQRPQGSDAWEPGDGGDGGGDSGD